MRLTFFLMLLAAGTLRAQEPIAKMYDDQVTLVENAVLSLAEAMPADGYDFAPTDGNFEGVRNFGEQIRHLATLMYISSARVLEEPEPYAAGTHLNGPDDVRSKEEILAFLKGALAHARRAMASLTEDNHMTVVPSGSDQVPRAATAAGLVRHSYSHYGQMVVYGRMNGIVPPASVPTGDEGVR